MAEEWLERRVRSRTMFSTEANPLDLLKPVFQEISVSPRENDHCVLGIPQERFQTLLYMLGWRPTRSKQLLSILMPGIEDTTNKETRKASRRDRSRHILAETHKERHTNIETKRDRERQRITETPGDRGAARREIQGDRERE